MRNNIFLTVLKCLLCEFIEKIVRLKKTIQTDINSEKQYGDNNDSDVIPLIVFCRHIEGIIREYINDNKKFVDYDIFDEELGEDMIIAPVLKPKKTGSPEYTLGAILNNMATALEKILETELLNEYGEETLLPELNLMGKFSLRALFLLNYANICADTLEENVYAYCKNIIIDRIRYDIGDDNIIDVVEECFHKRHIKMLREYMFAEDSLIKLALNQFKDPLRNLYDFIITAIEAAESFIRAKEKNTYSHVDAQLEIIKLLVSVEKMYSDTDIPLIEGFNCVDLDISNDFSLYRPMEQGSLVDIIVASTFNIFSYTIDCLSAYIYDEELDLLSLLHVAKASAEIILSLSIEDSVEVPDIFNILLEEYISAEKILILPLIKDKRKEVQILLKEYNSSH